MLELVVGTSNVVNITLHWTAKSVIRFLWPFLPAKES